MPQEILPDVIRFVQANFIHNSLEKKLGALIAFGSIIEGPSSDMLYPYIDSSFFNICECINNESVGLRDISTWLISRIATFHSKVLIELFKKWEENNLRLFIEILIKHLSDEPKVAVNICLIINELAEFYHRENSNLSSKYKDTIFDQYFQILCRNLIETSNRVDSVSNNIITKIESKEFKRSCLYNINSINCLC